MSKHLFGNRIEPSCGYCALGRPNSDGSSVLCGKMGVMHPSDSCRRFEYDPLLRVPAGHAVLESHEQSEFDLSLSL